MAGASLWLGVTQAKRCHKERARKSRRGEKSGTRTLDSYMNIILLLLGFSVVLVGLGEGI